MTDFFVINIDLSQFKVDDLVYLINPLTLKLFSTSCRFCISYIAPLAIYGIIHKCQSINGFIPAPL